MPDEPATVTISLRLAGVLYDFLVLQRTMLADELAARLNEECKKKPDELPPA